jgi:hypothetical protein
MGVLRGELFTLLTANTLREIIAVYGENQSKDVNIEVAGNFLY